MENTMFCFQCQETTLNKGCTHVGVCGKLPSTANLQDQLIYVTKLLCKVLSEAKAQGKEVLVSHEDQVNINLFMTITNANFDDQGILETIKLTESMIEHYQKLDIKQSVSILDETDEDIRSLKELITYGLKGMAAYHKHANVLGYRSDKINTFMQTTLASLLEPLTVEQLIPLTLEVGKMGVEVMALLDEANTSTYGNPEMTEVNIGVGKRPGILVSGHDLKDLELLLEQSKDSGVDIYTHSEMLPAHYYPHFKKYDHFVGNYGNAWWKQVSEFRSFNGPILLTTNCLMPPRPDYIDRVYSTGVVGYDQVKHIGNDKDFSIIIEHAKKCLPPKEIETGKIIGGFAHHQVLSLANQIVEAIKQGDIKKFVVMAGCDGRQKSREYYTDFAKELPKDTIILTAGCAKYKYNKLDLGTINGIPRVLDAGQCNDSYSLALIALKLKEVFELEDINDLPIIYNIAWYEQKAVIVLLALLSLGVKNIHLGPTLPAFISPNVAKYLIENFNIGTIENVEKDMEKFFGNKQRFTKEMIVGDVLRAHPQALDVLTQFEMGCMGCPASQAETLQDACFVHDISVEKVLEALNQLEGE